LFIGLKTEMIWLYFYHYLKGAQAQVRDPTVYRRMQFAAGFLPAEMPCYWETVTSFAYSIDIRGT